jgi:hypothetical protein
MPFMKLSPQCQLEIQYQASPFASIVLHNPHTPLPQYPRRIRRGNTDSSIIVTTVIISVRVSKLVVLTLFVYVIPLGIQLKFP